MRLISFLALFLTLVFTGDCFSFTPGVGDSLKKPGYSDTSVKRNFIIKTNVGTPFWYNEMEDQTAYSVTFERLFGKRYSLQLTLLGICDNVTDYYDAYHTYPSYKERGIQLIPECKFFVSKKKRYSGYYIGAFGFLNFEKDRLVYYPGKGQSFYYAGQYYTSPVTTALTITNAFGFGVSNGVQFYVFKRIVVDVLLGLGFKQVHSNTNGKYDSQMDVVGRAMFNIGYRFGTEKKKKVIVPDIPWD